MGAPLTIEQIILNHAIGVNLSDAETFDGHPIEDFSLVGHKHSAQDITTGIMNPERLPMATTNSSGIVGLSNSTDSDSQQLAATPYALRAVKNIALSKADNTHRHKPQDIDGGTFTKIIAAYSNKDYTTRQIRNIYISKDQPTSAAGQDGDIWFTYE